MYTVFGMSLSGNCYKVKLLLEQLGLVYRWQEVDVLGGETRRPEFLQKNPNGRVPLLEINDGKYLAESNAILCYLADGTHLWPAEKIAHAEVLQWLFFEQYSHEPYIAVARFILKFLPADHPGHAHLPQLHERGHQALAVMEKHLQARDYFVDDRYSIADIGLFAYTHRAADGGFDLTPYSAINAWLQRVCAQPKFIEMI